MSDKKGVYAQWHQPKRTTLFIVLAAERELGV